MHRSDHDDHDCEVHSAPPTQKRHLALLEDRRFAEGRAEEAKLEREVAKLVRSHARAYLSFLRTSTDDDTSRAAIAFNEKHTKSLGFDARTDCRVDGGVLDLGNVRGAGGTACATCRKCFTDSVFVGGLGERSSR